MFKYFAENIVFCLLKNKVLNVDNREVYVYSIEVILLNFILLSSLLGISIVGNSEVFFLGFLLFFVPIRTFAGGYHAKHSETCFVISVGVYMVGMVFFNYFPNLYKNVITVALFILAVIILLIWAPLKNANHPLTDYQYKRNQKVVFVLTIINIGLFILFSKVNYKIAVSEIIFIVFAAVSMLMGKFEDLIKSSIVSEKK